jgi:plasmid replication initiation protein
MKITNKKIIQSYIFTTAKYDFSVYEKRILFRIVETMQFALEGKTLKGNIAIEKELENGNRKVVIPMSAFLSGEDDKNHDRVKGALRDLESKRFEYEDDRVWKIIRIIQKPVFDKYDSIVTFELQSEIYETLLNFSKGFRRYELQTAMEFESRYAMRFYELFSEQKSPITYSIDSLKAMFQIEDKYKLTTNFINRVIEPAKKELDAKSPYSFKYKPIKVGRKVSQIRFYPVALPKNQDTDLERKELQKQTSPLWELDKICVNYLKEALLFSNDEIQNNIDLFKLANKKLDLVYELSLLKPKAEAKSNQKGYIINALKGKLQDN